MIDISQLQTLIENVTTRYRTWTAPKTNSPRESAQAVLAHLSPAALAALLPYRAFDPETGLYQNASSAGFILEMPPWLGSSEERTNLLTALISESLPPQADLQILLWASDKVGPVLAAQEKGHRGKGELLEWIATRRSRHLAQGAYTPLTPSTPHLVRHFRLFWIVSLACKHLDTQASRLITLREDMQSSLTSMGVPSCSLGVNDFISLIADLACPRQDPFPTTVRWREMEELSAQVTHPECSVRVHPDYLRFEVPPSSTQPEPAGEGWECRALGVQEFPETWTQGQMTSSIGQLFNAALQVPCPFVTSLHLRLMPHNGASVGNKLWSREKSKEARSPQAQWNLLAGRESQELDMLNARLARGEKLVKAFYQVALFAPQPEAAAAERKLKDLYRANGWKLAKARYLQLPSWLALLPMVMSEGLYQDLAHFKRLRTLSVTNAVSIAPLQGEHQGSGRGGMLLLGRRGQLATWSPFDNTEGNYNMVIAAPPGKGKSVFVQDYIRSLLGTGGRVWVIDLGRSYEKSCRAFGGEFIAFTEQTRICLNPFSLVNRLEEAMPLLKPLLASMARPMGNASDEELSFLEKAISESYETYGTRTTITHIARWLKNQNHPLCQNLHHLLYSYTEQGIYAPYFEGEASIDFTNPYVVLELQELNEKKDLQRLVLLVLLYQITQTMYRGDRTQPKSCILEEVWNLFGEENRSAARFIEAGYRTARRFTANFVAVSQGVNDYFVNNTATVAFNNADTKILFAHTPEAIEAMDRDKRIVMDAYAKRLYKSLQKTEHYSELAIHSPAGLSAYRLMLDPYSRILYSSKGVEFDAVRGWEAQGLSLQKAVIRVAHGQYPPASLSSAAAWQPRSNTTLGDIASC